MLCGQPLPDLVVGGLVPGVLMVCGALVYGSVRCLQGTFMVSCLSSDWIAGIRIHGIESRCPGWSISIRCIN